QMGIQKTTKLAIPEDVTRGFSRACEFKVLEILCSLVKRDYRVLDIGCGTGKFITTPLGYLGANIVGIDNDPLSIEQAGKNNPHSTVSFLCCAGESFECSPGFDLIICNSVLEHTKEPLRVLRNIKTLLRPDGTVFIGIPNGYGWYEAENLIPRTLSRFRLWKRLENYVLSQKVARDTLSQDNPHIHFFTIKNFMNLAAQAGLEVYRQINIEIIDGPVVNRTLLKVPALARWNVEWANMLPASLVTSWVFLLRHKVS
ncbi:MAG: class I SAM-dependent methyltransferase, partial [Dehalococcoidia bacterium]|nr:class I SAM-dependent methyltransferase [Dehalococcoidia bacterium]